MICTDAKHQACPTNSFADANKTNITATKNNTNNLNRHTTEQY